MDLVRTALLVATLALSASAAEITGKWKAVFLGPSDEWPKTVSTIVFDIEADGNNFTGMAHVGSWPGDAPISDGTIEGDRVSFTVIGNSPWRARSRQGESSGYPSLRFTGTISGREMNLRLLWGSVVIYGKVIGSDHKYEMKAKKTSD